MYSEVHDNHAKINVVVDGAASKCQLEPRARVACTCWHNHWHTEAEPVLILDNDTAALPQK